MTKKRMTKWTFIGMLIVAIIMDIIQIILEFFAIGVVGDTILTIIGWVIFFPWLHMHGIRFTGKIAKIAGLGSLLEFIPIVNALPAWTFMIIRVYASTKTPPIAAVVTDPKQALKNKAKSAVPKIAGEGEPSQSAEGTKPDVVKRLGPSAGNVNRKAA